MQKKKRVMHVITCCHTGCTNVTARVYLPEGETLPDDVKTMGECKDCCPQPADPPPAE